jgi:peptide chain release factor 2
MILNQSEWYEKKTSLLELYSCAPLVSLNTEIQQLEISMQTSNFWNDAQTAANIQKKHTLDTKQIKQWHRLKELVDDIDIAFELEEESSLEGLIKKVIALESELQIQQFLHGAFDTQGVFLSIHAGAGGLDAEDFAGMLVSQYQSFCKNQSWSCTMISLSAGAEAGVKSSTLHITGDFVYGLLKEEAGVHRLIRLSPFNSGNTRETSFALVEILPDSINEQVAIGDIPEEDLRWEYSTSSGKGGQSVNTTYSAVKLYHLPTNITVSCQNERSQVQNKAQALAILKNRLAVVEVQKQDELRQELRGALVSAEWGSQIRTYVLHPYKMVKDHRCNWETADVQGVLDGDVLPVIWAMKKFGLK